MLTARTVHGWAKIDSDFYNKHNISPQYLKKNKKKNT